MKRLMILPILIFALVTLCGWAKSPTQTCIESFYDECHYKPPAAEGAHKTNNKCMQEKIDYCYCLYQQLNCK